VYKQEEDNQKNKYSNTKKIRNK